MTGLLHRHGHPTLPVPRSSVPTLRLPPGPAVAVAVTTGAEDSGAPVAPPVLYGCFSCPWCYLASQRWDLLPDPPDLAERPPWRMVEPDPHLPVTGVRLDTAARARRQTELEQVRALLLPGEQLPDRAPALLPHTGPAVAGYAEACGAGVADRVRQVLFDAYWRDGADLGSPEVLRRLLVEPLLAGHSDSWPVRVSGYGVTLAGGPITSQAWRRTRVWQAGWQQTAGVLPVLVATGGTVAGPAVLTALRTAPPL